MLRAMHQQSAYCSRQHRHVQLPRASLYCFGDDSSHSLRRGTQPRRELREHFIARRSVGPTPFAAQPSVSHPAAFLPRSSTGDPGCAQCGADEMRPGQSQTAAHSSLSVTLNSPHHLTTSSSANSSACSTARATASVSTVRPAQPRFNIAFAHSYSPFSIRNRRTTCPTSSCLPSTASFIARTSSALTWPASRSIAVLDLRMSHQRVVAHQRHRLLVRREVVAITSVSTVNPNARIGPSVELPATISTW